MAFIERKDGKIFLDDAEFDERGLFDALDPLIRQSGFDHLPVSTGVNPSPDFGYFELGSRFWRASLCVYFVGASRGFWESGAGYPEPWLFNARHSIELYLKGLISYTFWYQDLQQNELSSGHIIEIENLNRVHGLKSLYSGYKGRLENIISKWDLGRLSQPPEVGKISLSTRGENILSEIDEADDTSFRFRYPSLVIKKPQEGRRGWGKPNGWKKIDRLQELGWMHDDTQLLPITGLPRKAGYFFNHEKVMNALHELVKEIKMISSYHDTCWDMIGNSQDEMGSWV